MGEVGGICCSGLRGQYGFSRTSHWSSWQQGWGLPSPFCCTNFSRVWEPCSITRTWAALKNLDWATLKAVYTQHKASSPAFRTYLQELFVEPGETSRCTCLVPPPGQHLINKAPFLQDLWDFFLQPMAALSKQFCTLSYTISLGGDTLP